MLQTCSWNSVCAGEVLCQKSWQKRTKSWAFFVEFFLPSFWGSLWQGHFQNDFTSYPPIKSSVLKSNFLSTNQQMCNDSFSAAILQSADLGDKEKTYFQDFSASVWAFRIKINANTICNYSLICLIDYGGSGNMSPTHHHPPSGSVLYGQVTTYPSIWQIFIEHIWFLRYGDEIVVKVFMASDFWEPMFSERREATAKNRITQLWEMQGREQR